MLPGICQHAGGIASAISISNSTFELKLTYTCVEWLQCINQSAANKPTRAGNDVDTLTSA